MDKNFFLLLPFVTVYLVNACLKSSFLKSYDLQYLKQMSMALYFSHPIFIEWARYGFSNLPLSYPDRGKLIFVVALFGSHLFGLAMLSYHNWQNEKTAPPCVELVSSSASKKAIIFVVSFAGEFINASEIGRAHV